MCTPIDAHAKMPWCVCGATSHNVTSIQNAQASNSKRMELVSEVGTLLSGQMVPLNPRRDSIHD